SYTIYNCIFKGFNTFLLNPFGTQYATFTAYLNSIQLVGQNLSGKTTSTGVDIKDSREFGALAGGAMGIDIGAEAHQDKE
ncbi:hypothetical protein, partial [Undibacterium sp. 10I3]|uniref:hypothetical protein n=1 Tax=Undibacterium sp. 10I3 TaxID=3048579 RepID=UPI002B23E73C